MILRKLFERILPRRKKCITATTVVSGTVDIAMIMPVQKLGICPKCNGSGRVLCPPKYRSSFQQNGWFGYDPNTKTIECDNCGAQYQHSKPSGIVKMSYTGKPCVHRYSEEQLSAHYVKYNCKLCGDVYFVDLR
jgi:transcription elongation factor Elf1